MAKTNEEKKAAAALKEYKESLDKARLAAPTKLDEKRNKKVNDPTGLVDKDARTKAVNALTELIDNKEDDKFKIELTTEALSAKDAKTLLAAVKDFARSLTVSYVDPDKEADPELVKLTADRLQKCEEDTVDGMRAWWLKKCPAKAKNARTAPIMKALKDEVEFNESENTLKWKN